jgi:zinc protease
MATRVWQRVLLSVLLAITSLQPATAQSAHASQQIAKNKSAEHATTSTKVGFTKIRAAAGVVEYRLESNQLKVLLVENHVAPVVTSTIVYHVGSRNEAVGTTGSTHFLEHMMFKDTTHFASLPELLKPIGGDYNADTGMDRTMYFETVPADKLALILAVDADRMRNLTLRQEDRDTEMSVVRNEMEIGDNDPANLLSEGCYATAFQAHPYHHPTIGWRSDVENVPIQRLRDFYRKYYWPNNATLILVGDFQPQEALSLIAQTYGKIPASPSAIPDIYTVEPPQRGERRFEIHAEGKLPQVLIAYRIPQATDKGTYPLAVLASVLQTVSESGRLERDLVARGLATKVVVSRDEQRDPSLFMIGATVAPGQSVQALEAALEDEMAKLVTEPITTADVERARVSNGKFNKLLTADPQKLAEQLGEAEVTAGSWTFFTDWSDNMAKVTADDVLRVVKTYFVKDNRTVGIFVPTTDTAATAEPSGDETDNQTDDSAEDETTPAHPQHKRSQGFVPVMHSHSQSASRSVASRVTRVVLPNGLTLLVMPNPGTGSVFVTGNLLAGDYASINKLVPTLTASMLTHGTSQRNKADVLAALDQMGTELSFESDTFRVKFDASVVSDDLSAFIPLLSDLLRHPAFSDKELEEVKKEEETDLKTALSDTDDAAKRKLTQSLYAPGSVYYQQSVEQDLDDLKAATAEDLRQFHEQHYSPNGMMLTIVGDIKPQAVVALVKDNFGDWRGAEPERVVVGQPDWTAAKRLITVPISDKADASILIGKPVNLKRDAQDYLAARLAVDALGGDTLSSRLGRVVRVKEGLTYGILSDFEDVDFGWAPWTVTLTANPANTDKALRSVRVVLDQFLKQGISDQELADEANQSAGNFVVGLRTSEGLATALTEFETNGLGIGKLDTYVRDLRQVTKAQVNAAIRKYLDPSAVVTVVAGSVDADKTKLANK